MSERQVNEMGEVVLGAINKRSTENGIIHAIEEVAQKINIHPKTLERRLKNGGWLHDELLRFQREIKSEELDEYIRQQYRAAMRA